LLALEAQNKKINHELFIYYDYCGTHKLKLDQIYSTTYRMQCHCQAQVTHKNLGYQISAPSQFIEKSSQPSLQNNQAATLL